MGPCLTLTIAEDLPVLKLKLAKFESGPHLDEALDQKVDYHEYDGEPDEDDRGPVEKVLQPPKIVSR